MNRISKQLFGIAKEVMGSSRKAWSFLESWRSGVVTDMERALLMGQRGFIVSGPDYYTFEKGGSGKFHMFVIFQYKDKATGMTKYVGSNAHGKIGKQAKIFEIARSTDLNEVKRELESKVRLKLAKGYSEQY